MTLMMTKTSICLRSGTSTWTTKSLPCYETDEEKIIREKERETYISADNNNGRPTKASLEALRKAYLDADKQYQAAETIEQQLKYYPEDDLYNYLGVLYHNSGNYYKAIRFFEKALSYKKNVWALLLYE